MKVVAVDDHILFRAGLRHVLSTAADCRLVGEAGSATDAFAIIDRERPDVVLMDIALPGMDGVTATRELGKRSPGTKVLMLSVHDQIRDVLDSLNAGACGYALKGEEPEVLVAAIKTIARGDRYLSPPVAAYVATYEARRRRAFDVLAILSDRERTVFRLAAECLMAREIAEELKISRKTVDTHLYRIHRKLGLRSSAELVRLAASLGMVRSWPTPGHPAPHAGSRVVLAMDVAGVTPRQPPWGAAGGPGPLTSAGLPPEGL